MLMKFCKIQGFLTYLMMIVGIRTFVRGKGFENKNHALIANNACADSTRGDCRSFKRLYAEREFTKRKQASSRAMHVRIALGRIVEALNACTRNRRLREESEFLRGQKVAVPLGVTGFEPAASWSQTRRSSQAELHPAVRKSQIGNFKLLFVI